MTRLLQQCLSIIINTKPLDVFQPMHLSYSDGDGFGSECDKPIRHQYGKKVSDSLDKIYQHQTASLF